MSLLSKLSKASTLEHTSVFSKSSIIDGSIYPTDLFVLNIAYSGSINGGVTSGLTQLAGPSKHFKTLLSLLCASAFLQKEEDGVLMFYDNEFGASKEYFEMMGIDTDRVLHLPFTSVEDLKFDIVKKLGMLKREDKVMIIIDSIGNAASKKEIDDAESEKSVADMTRAKSIKALWRIVTPHLTAKDIPCIAINHTYQSQCVTGDTEVLMHDGTVKYIKDVRVGDLVIADDGSKQKVTDTYDPVWLGSEAADKFGMFELDFNGVKIKCTGNHKFLLKSGEWIEAKDLKEGDEIQTIQDV